MTSALQQQVDSLFARDAANLFGATRPNRPAKPHGLEYQGADYFKNLRPLNPEVAYAHISVSGRSDHIAVADDKERFPQYFNYWVTFDLIQNLYKIVSTELQNNYRLRARLLLSQTVRDYKREADKITRSSSLKEGESVYVLPSAKYLKSIGTQQLESLLTEPLRIDSEGDLRRFVSFLRLFQDEAGLTSSKPDRGAMVLAVKELRRSLVKHGFISEEARRGWQRKEASYIRRLLTVKFKEGEDR